MTGKTPEEKPIYEDGTAAKVDQDDSKSPIWSYTLAILSVILTASMIVAIIYYNDKLRDLQQWGYIGAFLISILGGATVVVPVPMVAVVFALGGTMANPWQVALLGISAAIGELLGGLTIYMTGQGAGRAISSNKNGRIQKAYERMLNFIKRRGAAALFLVTFVMNPFFYPAAFAAGALHLGLKKFVPVVLVGKIIKCMTVVYAGYFGIQGIFHALGIKF